MIQRCLKFFTVIALSTLCFLSDVWASVTDQPRRSRGQDFSELVIKGRGLVKYSWVGIKLYHVSYLVGEHKRVLHFEPLRDLSKDNMVKGWDYGFEKNPPPSQPQYEKAVKWIKKSSPEVKKGKNWSIVIEQNPKNKQQLKTTIYYDGKVVGATDDVAVAEIVHSPWCGDNPVDDKVKEQLTC